jgi:hypothetical protein
MARSIAVRLAGNPFSPGRREEKQDAFISNCRAFLFNHSVFRKSIRLAGGRLGKT